MGLLNLFRKQWSGKDMSPEDRRQLFWYLKRKSSYTAWKREADAFDRFADIFEKQVIEEPTPKPAVTIGGMDWEERYPDILRAQVAYEQGLRRLLEGDRTIFLYNSLGVLHDATRYAHYWYGEIVHHGAQGDHFFDGKYVPDMAAALEDFFACSDDTGYLEAGTVGARAPHFWGEWMRGELARACHLPAFDEVPVAAANVSVDSDEEVPVFGIYEPQTKDGCMNYLLAGAPAPRLCAGDGWDHDLEVTWRLIWQDDRYIDGHIPAEEQDYFPADAAAVRAVRTAAADEVLSVPTGAACPRSGVWAVLDNIHGRTVLTEGDRMPPFDGRSVTWVWTSRA